MRIRTQRLPIGYREVEYLESTGTQYINTEYITTGAEVYQFESNIIFTTFDASDLGIGGNNGYGYGVSPSTHKFWWGDIEAELNKKYQMNFYASSSARYGIVDGVQCNTNAYPYANQKIMLFGRGNASGIQLYSKYKLCFFKLIINSNLVRNFIPCLRTSDNKPGMYDTVENTFYTNQGTGEFLYGPYKDSYKISLYPRLPSDYQEVEYIQSSGGQYIDSLFIPNKNTTVDIHIYQVTTSYSWNFIFGARSTAGNDEYEVCFQKDSNKGWRSDFGTTNDRIFFNDTNGVGDFYIYKNKNTCYINNNIVVHESVNINPGYSLTIFGTNYSGGVRGGETAQIKLYYCKIYDNEVLVRDYIPCYRKSDNVIGLFDTVNQQFYTNSGTGTFTKGNNINNTISCKVAGGQSDTYYNYNQQITHNTFDELGEWRIYMPSRSNLVVANNKATVTSAESGGWAYEYGLAQSLAKPIQINHKYFVSAKVTTSYDTRVKFEINSNEGIFDDFVANTPKVIEGILTTPVWYENAMLIFPTSGFDPGKWFSVENVNVFDLTDWYGAGNEPTTVAEIRNKFNKDYYDFSINATRLTRYQINSQMGHNS